MSINSLKQYLGEHSQNASLSQPGEEVYEYRTHISELYHFFERHFEEFINIGLIQTEYTTHSIKEDNMEPYTVSKLQIKLLSDYTLSFIPQGIHFPGSNGVIMIEGGLLSTPEILHLVNDKDACKYIWKIKSTTTHVVDTDLNENSLADLLKNNILLKLL